MKENLFTIIKINYTLIKVFDYLPRVKILKLVNKNNNIISLEIKLTFCEVI